MTTVSNIPSPSVPVIGPDGRISMVWYQFLTTLFSRTGGMQGTSTLDLSIDMPEDSGIEELKALVYGLFDLVHMVPPPALAMPADDQAPPAPPAPPPDDPSGRIEALEAAMQRLQIEIEAIRQGQQL